MTQDIVSALDAMTLTLSAAFQARSARDTALFLQAVVVCLGRQTVTNLARSVGKPNADRPSRLHRFYSRAVCVLQYVERRTRLLHRIVALWSPTSKRPLRLVIVGDPDGHERDAFILSTDLEMAVARIGELPAGSWGEEEAIRESKLSLGFDEVRSWSRMAVERQAAIVLVVHTEV